MYQLNEWVHYALVNVFRIAVFVIAVLNLLLVVLIIF